MNRQRLIITLIIANVALVAGVFVLYRYYHAVQLVNVHEHDEPAVLVKGKPLPASGNVRLAAEIGLYETWKTQIQEEVVTFYAQRNDHSNELIARRGVLVVRPQAHATVLVMHGYTVSKVDVGFLRLMFPQSNIFLFDFRAHGEHTIGQASTMGHDEVFDVFAAVDFLKSHTATAKLPIVGYGFSMGAATAIEAQARDPRLFQALILDCPFDSTENLLHRSLDRFDWPGRSLIERYAFDPRVQPVIMFLLRFLANFDSSITTAPKSISPLASAKNLTIPTLFITCYADARVPVDAVASVYANARGYKRLWVTRGARHYGSIFHNPELYQQVVGNFIEKVLKQTYIKDAHERVIVDVPRAELEAEHAQLYAEPMDPTMLALLYA